MTWHDQLEKPVVMVLGPYRSGTSMVAGMLNILGVDMGESFRGPRNPKGFFEDRDLGSVLKRQFYPEPDLEQKTDMSTQINFLRFWYNNRSVSSSAPVIGGKHPILCLMIPQLRQAFGSAMKIIAVRRSLDVSIQSLCACQWKAWTLEKVQKAQKHLYDQRELNLAGDASVLWVDYEQLLSHPEQGVQQIINHLGIIPLPEQLNEAIFFVDPKMNHREAFSTQSNSLPPHDAPRIS